MSRTPSAVPAPHADRPSGVYALGRTDAAAERAADRAADALTGPRGLFTDWSFAAVPRFPRDDLAGEVAIDLPGHGTPLDPQLTDRLGPALGADLSGVRVHQDAAAHDTARRAGADALTVGQHVAFAPGRYDPRSRDGQRCIVHELAHVAQEQHGVARCDSPKGQTPAPTAPSTLAGLPEADRKRIQVVTTDPINPTGLDEKFATTGTTMTLTLPPDTAVTIDASAASTTAGFDKGMSNLVAALVGTHDVAPAPLPRNTTASVLLDLTKYGGKAGIYRFTHNAPPAAAGSTATARVLVEFLGTASPPAGAKVPPEPKEGEKPAPDPVADKIKNNAISHSYRGAELEALRAAVDQVPASHLKIISGVTFKRASVHPTEPENAGAYSQQNHTITMYDLAFKGAQNAYLSGTIATSYATRLIIHEIGHAVDVSNLRTTNVAREKAAQEKADLSKKYPDPTDPTGYHYPLGGPEEQEVKAKEAAASATEAAMLAARSRSGTKTIPDPAKPGDFKDEIGTTTKGIKYREAALKDGLAVSKYGVKDWQENYAESYSLYLTAPETLKLLRPNIYAHLVATLPK